MLAPANQPISRSGTVSSQHPTTSSWVVSSPAATTNLPWRRQGVLRPSVGSHCTTLTQPLEARSGLIRVRVLGRIELSGTFLALV
ncbi:hypothetical protein K443DRAFT_664144 [Laccaria amethystina LaAM-08-1]|uniref:Uncharacterized protein n=1 Tax=Laccaria amethystina LaAM-08-1 TaxID=1095629 RepID=A0A0C9WL36_9AGAR|nr:hypothetical protein K443DRAFT_664144 [Laccaria amethystina LaAM-08-1]